MMIPLACECEAVDMYEDVLRFREYVAFSIRWPSGEHTLRISRVFENGDISLDEGMDL